MTVTRAGLGFGPVPPVAVVPVLRVEGGASMASVKMVQRVSGTRDGVAWPDVGELIEVSAEEAEGLVTAGVAEEVEAAKPSKPSKTAASPAKRAEKALATAVEER